MAEESLQAAVVHNYGGPEQIVMERVPCPKPKAGEVLVRLKAAGVNPADWKARAGYMKQFRPLTFPWIPGLEGAGVVDVAGPDVTSLKAGEAVYGPIGGSYAEYAVAPAKDLYPKPKDLSFEEAASVPVGALTAWGAVIQSANVQPGQRVLVQGGAGGVGAFAVQLARWKGAHVIATSSGANVDFVRSLGAETVVDYQKEKVEDVVKDVDAVIDTVGGEVLERSLQVIKRGGILVTIAGSPDAKAAEARGVRATRAGRADAAALQQISELLESKKVRPVVGKVFSLAQAGQAQELSQTGHGRGRIVLRIGD
ncbi:MAG: NADP-dependent oxidoreductase [Chloroflexi bacterium]|nr:NADP-dependent oxidoreductase [Chloroflexota bacterium]